MNIPVEVFLFVLGILLGLFWFSVTVVPLVYGLPNALLWMKRGWANGGAVYYVATPVLWNILLIAVVLALRELLPGVARYLLGSPGFAFGQMLGIVLTAGRAIFSNSARRDLQHDFVARMRKHLTPLGTNVADKSLNKEVEAQGR